ncbi:mesenchyme-specific cell surface glycoprotein-like isoform X1 [Branchiostoma lanceolatum]|uniref:mesenchyme-specific cell surface glycoprotein-like isoform X1 n=2 Tax=Branchiostoma lanceolatum TaxID=7740 RepID=UPI0034540E36
MFVSINEAIILFNNIFPFFLRAHYVETPFFCTKWTAPFLTSLLRKNLGIAYPYPDRDTTQPPQFPSQLYRCSGTFSKAEMSSSVFLPVYLAMLAVPGVLGAVSLRHVSSVYLPYGFAGDGTPQFGMGDHGAVEQITYDPKNHLIYTVGEATILNVIDIRYPSAPRIVFRQYLPGGATDIDSCGNYIAVAIHAEPHTRPGTVLVFDMFDPVTNNLRLIHTLQVGPLPDMLKFTKDCRKLVTCNEGEPANTEAGDIVDPEGSATIIEFSSGDLADKAEPTVRTATFHNFEQHAYRYQAKGLRWLFPEVTHGPENHTRVTRFSLSQSLEPEYLAFSHNETKAYVVLQENNAIAVLDLATASFEEIYPLGSKYWGTASLDTSDEDGGINLREWPIYSMFQPDGMKTFTHRGRHYILTANEGDNKKIQIGEEKFSDIVKGRDVMKDSLLGADFSSGRVRRALGDETELGCIHFSTFDGRDRWDNSKFSALHAFGARGFSVWDAEDVSLVWDSGDDAERMIANYHPDIFNSYYKESVLDKEVQNNFDKNSCKKGPETEAVSIGSVGDQTVLFVANERSSTIMLYTLPDTDIISPVFQSIYWPGEGTGAMTWREAYDARTVGDVDPEDLRFVSSEDSPNGRPLLLVTGTVSGTVSVYEVYDNTDVTASAGLVLPGVLTTYLTAVALALYTVQ